MGFFRVVADFFSRCPIIIYFSPCGFSLSLYLLVRTKWFISFIYSFSSLYFGGGTLLVDAKEMSFFHRVFRHRALNHVGINVTE